MQLSKEEDSFDIFKCYNEKDCNSERIKSSIQVPNQLLTCQPKTMKFETMEDDSPTFDIYNNFNSQSIMNNNYNNNFNSKSIMKDITFKNISHMNSNDKYKISVQTKTVPKKVDYNSELLDDLIFDQALNGSW